MVWITAAAAISILFFSIGRRARSAAGHPDAGPVSTDGSDGGSPPSKAGVARSIIEFPNRLVPQRVRRHLLARFDEASETPGLSGPYLTGIGIWVTIGAPLAVLTLSGFSPAGLIVAPAAAVFGLVLPRIMAVRARARHMEGIRTALPDTADILYSLVLGGKNLDQAFKQAASMAPEPLSPFLLSAVREMELGSTRAEAFGRLAARCPLRELKSLLQSLIEAEKRGYSLSWTLSVFSREIRLRRRDALREAGAKAPLKMLAPLVFLILPASVLLTVGPTFLATLQRVF